MTIKFNDEAIKKFVKDKRLAKQTALEGIEDVPGLHIRVSATGGASYVCRYQVGSGEVRRKWSGKSLGKHGVLTLAAAKAACMRVMSERARLLEQGVAADPVADARRQAKGKGSSITLRELWDQRLELCDPPLAPSSVEKYQRLLEADVFPELGDTPVGQLDAETFVELLERVEKRSKSSAHNVKAALSKMFGWAHGRRKVAENPMRGLSFNYNSKARKRVATDDEIAKLWAAIDSPAFGAEDGTKLALKLSTLVGLRGGELVGATVSELQLEGATPRWTVPPERMKRKSDEDGHAHIIPLPPLAVGLLRLAIKESKARGNGYYVFPGYMVGPAGGQRKHLTRHALTSAMAHACGLAGIENLHVHDMRKTITTWLSERFESARVLGIILHHAREGVLGKHYDFSGLEGPVRAAYLKWASHVETVTSGKARENVVRLGQVVRATG